MTPDSAPPPLAPIPEEEVAVVLPGYYDHLGRPLKYPPEVVEATLYEVAAHGGNIARACQALADRGITQAYPSDEGAPLPRSVVSEWVKRRFRNRYHEIVTTGTRELEEVIAQQGVNFALQAAEGQQEALKQTLAGLSDANAIEASQVLRNISQARSGEIDKALALRGRGPADKVSKSLQELTQSLRRLGLVVDDEDDVQEAEVVEGDVAELSSG
jgi:hypothetical protein